MAEAAVTAWLTAFKNEHPESFAKYAEHMMKCSQDEDAKTEVAMEIGATFQASCTNENGLLNEAQFTDFLSKIDANREARYGSVPKSDAAAMWPAFNATTADVDGVSIADVKTQAG